MMEKVYEKLEEMMNRPRELRKTFSFNIEDLQDKPEICLNEIKSYMDEHGDKFDDFWFESYVDENTFRPVLIMHVIPKPEWQKMMLSDRIWENLVPVTRRVETIKERVNHVMQQYLFEKNTAETRKRMASDIQKLITVPGKDIEVIDITTDKDVDAQKFSYIVRDGENEVSLAAYIDFLSTL